TRDPPGSARWRAFARMEATSRARKPSRSRPWPRWRSGHRSGAASPGTRGRGLDAAARRGRLCRAGSGWRSWRSPGEPAPRIGAPQVSPDRIGVDPERLHIVRGAEARDGLPERRAVAGQVLVSRVRHDHRDGLAAPRERDRLAGLGLVDETREAVARL